MKFLLSLSSDTLSTGWVLFRVMLPALLLVRIISMLGVLAPLGAFMAPVMTLAGLPGETGIVWITGMLTNMYGGLALLAGVIGPLNLTVGQVTTLGMMLLLAHSMPVEVTVAARSGVSPLLVIPLRVGSALAAGVLLRVSGFVRTFREAPAVLWRGVPQSGGWGGWLLDLLATMGTILAVIFLVLLALRILERLGFTGFLRKVLRPAFRLVGIGPEANTITVVGLVLGISYGGGLVIKAASRGDIPARQVTAAVCFMSLCHAVVEDTALVATLGAWTPMISLGRILFSWGVMTLVFALTPRTARET
jgi:spore maturation protein SpmB